MKQEFIKFLDALMEASPELVSDLMTDDIEAYISSIKEVKNKPLITDNGKIVLKFLQDTTEVRTWKAKDIADNIEISSRGVSGTLRKLVSDGFVEKLGENPAVYTITEKGKNFNINDNGE